MGWIHPQNLQVIAKELEFIECQSDHPVFRVPLDIGEKLSGGKRTPDHVALEPDHVHAIGRKAAKRLVKGGGHVADSKDEAGHCLAVRGVCLDSLPGHHQKTGGVVPRILDVGGENVEAIYLGGERGTDGGRVSVARICEGLRRAGGVGNGDRLETACFQNFSALTKRHRMTRRPFHVTKSSPLRSEELEPNRTKVFRDDEKSGVGQQMMDVRNSPIKRIFNR